MKNKHSSLGFVLLTIIISSTFFIFSSLAINNPDYIEVITPGDAIYFPFNLTQNDKLRIKFEVTDGGNKDVDFYILDSENFDKWDNDESFTYLIFRNRAVYARINFVVPSNDTYYVIFSNSFSIITSKTVEIDFTLNPESNDGFDFSIPITLIILISVITGIALLSVLIIYIKRKTPKKVIMSTEKEIITEDQSDQIPDKTFCPLCGEEILDKEGEYCSKCGGTLNENS